MLCQQQTPGFQAKAKRLARAKKYVSILSKDIKLNALEKFLATTMACLGTQIVFKLYMTINTGSEVGWQWTSYFVARTSGIRK